MERKKVSAGEPHLNKEIGVYIVECADGSLYPGWTNDMDARLIAHNEGLGAKYTRSRRPVRLVYWQPCESKSAALKREREIKDMNRAEKLSLIEKMGELV